MKTRLLSKPRPRKGVISITVVLVVGIFCLALMAVAHRATMRSIDTQRKVQLQLDYEAREQALIRAYVTLAPVYAANTMIDGSQNASFSNNTSFESLYTEAGNLASFSKAIDETNYPGIKTNLGLTNARSLNVADADYTSPLEYVGAHTDKYDTPGATGATSNAKYPPPLYVRGQGSSGLVSRDTVDSASSTFSSRNLLLSSALAYSTVGTPHTDLYANDDEYNQYNLIPYPNIHFGFGQPGDVIVGKHNWWSLYMHPEIKHMNATGLVRNATDGAYLDREYVLSIIELPAQMPINGATAIKLGQIGGEAWKNVTISGAVVGEHVTTEGSATIDRLAVRKGSTISGGTVIGSNGETVTGGSGDREAFEAQHVGFYPISKSSDTSRAMYIAINPGNAFFDRYASIGKFNASPVAGAGNRLSAESWYEYAMGCNQCAMKLDVIDVVSSTDQTPTKLRFTYISGGAEVSQEFSKADGSWPADGEVGGDTFPFEQLGAMGGRPAFKVHLDRLGPWMLTLGSVPDSLAVNHSLVINVDYTQGSVVKPSVPSSSDDLCVLLDGTSDLTAYPKGFSLVTNLRVYVTDDINTVETTPPAGVTGPYKPPFSMFCPELRVGTDSNNTFVQVDGMLGTVGDSSGAISVGEIKLGTNEMVSNDRTTLNLKKYNHPAELPPIVLMNWLVVVQAVK